MREKMVSDFHKKLDIDFHQDLTQAKPETRLVTNGEELKKTAEYFLTQYKETLDPRWLRAHLILEEFSEMLIGMGSSDELQTLDALADLQYVVSGSAVTFDLPLEMAFLEVHRSNMTKEKQPKDVDKARVRDKGPNYQPPDLRMILEAYRKRS